MVVIAHAATLNVMATVIAVAPHVMRMGAAMRSSHEFEIR
jgi:hypothetical protein